MELALPKDPDFARANAELVVSRDRAPDHLAAFGSPLHKRISRDAVEVRDRRPAAQPDADPAVVVMAPDGDAGPCRRLGEVYCTPRPLAVADRLAAFGP